MNANLIVVLSKNLLVYMIISSIIVSVSPSIFGIELMENVREYVLLIVSQRVQHLMMEHVNVSHMLHGIIFLKNVSILIVGRLYTLQDRLQTGQHVHANSTLNGIVIFMSV